MQNHEQGKVYRKIQSCEVAFGVKDVDGHKPFCLVFLMFLIFSNVFALLLEFRDQYTYF